MKRTLLILFILFSVSTFAADELDPALEEEAKAIEGLVISPCCWRAPVAVHYSPASDEIRAEVREMLSSGLNRDEILQKYVAEYGDRILAKPPAKGFSLLAYFLPVIFLGVGAAVAAVVIKKLRPQVAAAEEPVEAATSKKDKYSRQLEKELWG